MQLSTPTVLSQAEIERVHRQSLGILETTGLSVEHPDCRELLMRAGAKTDPGSDRVRLPAALVEECLKQVPSSFRLYRRDGTPIEIGIDTCVLGSLVIDPWVIDYETQQPRRPVLNDVVRHTRLGDALDTVGFMYRMDAPPVDVAGPAAYVRTLEAFASNSIKPILAAPASDESLRDWLDLAEILADGQSLTERPFMTLCAPVTTPLFFHSLNFEIMRQGIRRGMPICGQTEPIAGTTAPYSFAGGLLMGHCENLFLAVVTQLLQPGCAFAYSIGNALTDMRTGHALFYPAEKMLWKIAMSQLARSCRLPVEGEAAGSMVGRYDTQNGIEIALHMLASIAHGGGMFNGLGSCLNACAMSAEMIVIHTELAQLMKHLRAGIEVTDEKLSADSIMEVGPRGQFLDQDLTVKLLHSSEFFTPATFDMLGERGASFENSLLARAHERVEHLVASHKPGVRPSVVAEVQRWAEKRLAANRS